MNLLTYSVPLFGISAPWFSWTAAVVLVVWPSWEILKLRSLSRRQESISNNLLNDIEEIRKQFPVQGNKGLAAIAIDRLQNIFLDIPSLIGVWNIYRKNLIYRSSSSNNDDEQVWATESAINILPEDLLLGSGFNKRHFNSIPGIVTGIGLLMTFLAILVALLHVSINADNKVIGLQNLIGGLSGKFISSVAALFAATVFLFLEKKYFHRLDVLRLSIATSIDSLIPSRSRSCLLEEICANLSEQTTAFRTFNADLSLKLCNSFSESMGPTLERMVTAIADLNQLIRSAQAESIDAIREMNLLLQRSEEQRQESISGQLEALLRQLHQSLESAIANMSTAFNKSLTGSAQEQFGRVAETVGATADVLGGMNKKFGETQLALQELISLAKQSTENQLSNGSALIEKMVNVIGGTLVQMQDKMSELSNKMTTTIEGTAERSAEAAGEIISEVRNLNEHSAEKLLEVLRKHEEQIDKVDSLKQILQEAVEEFGEYVTGYNQINHDLRNVSQEINATMSVFSESSQKLKEGQESFNKIADFAKVQIQTLSASQEQQHDLWRGINSSMERYSKTFQNVESSAANILEQISQNLQEFSRVTQEHFSKIVTVANEHVNLAVGKLSTSIEELSEKLDDLTDTVSEIDKISNRFKR